MNVYFGWCPSCGTTVLLEYRGALVCSACRTKVETCCEGAAQPEQENE